MFDRILASCDFRKFRICRSTSEEKTSSALPAAYVSWKNVSNVYTGRLSDQLFRESLSEASASISLLVFLEDRIMLFPWLPKQDTSAGAITQMSWGTLKMPRTMQCNVSNNRHSLHRRDFENFVIRKKKENRGKKPNRFVWMRCVRWVSFLVKKTASYNEVRDGLSVQLLGQLRSLARTTTPADEAKSCHTCEAEQNRTRFRHDHGEDRKRKNLGVV